MIRYTLNRLLETFKKRYDYDIRYQQEILQTDLLAYAKFLGFQTLTLHSGNVPAGPLYAARIRATLSEDCGPCAQLVVNMAQEAKISARILRAIIDLEVNQLPTEIALVVNFTERVLNHQPEADDLRDTIIELWGKKGLIAISFAIASSRVYPALKYSLGYGKACTRIHIGDDVP